MVGAKSNEHRSEHWVLYFVFHKISFDVEIWEVLFVMHNLHLAVESKHLVFGLFELTRES